MSANSLIVKVPLGALNAQDVIVRDPDHDDVEVCWQITKTRLGSGVFLIDYRTDDGKEGVHGFEDLDAWVTVLARNVPAPDVFETGTAA